VCVCVCVRACVCACDIGHYYANGALYHFTLVNFEFDNFILVLLFRRKLM